MKPTSHSPHWHPLKNQRVIVKACLWVITSVIGHAALAAPASTPASASAPNGHAYRCKQGNGAFEYSQLPCSPQAELIKASDARTESQLRQSLLNDKEEVKLAAQMTRERRHAERLAAEAHAQGLTRAAHQRHAQMQSVVSPGSVTPLPKTSVANAGSGNPSTNTTYKPHGHRHFRAVVPKSTEAAAK